jgi:flagellar motor component MotA
MIRYIISLIFGVFFFLFTGIVCGSTPYTFYDLPSLIFAVVCPFVIMSTLYGGSALKSAFNAPFRKDSSKAVLSRAYEFFTAYSKLTWFTGLLGILIGIVGMFKNLEDKSAFGPNLAVAFVSIIYAALVNNFVIIPFQILLNKKMKELEK